MDTLGPAILFFIERLSSLWRLKCTSIIEKGAQSVSFIERFYCIYCVEWESRAIEGGKSVLIFRIRII